MVEETEYDDVVQCDHSYDRRCHTTYTTNYESQQEEDCEENFRKNCFIEYEQIAFNETATVCRTPLVKDCDVQDPKPYNPEPPTPYGQDPKPYNPAPPTPYGQDPKPYNPAPPTPYGQDPKPYNPA